MANIADAITSTVRAIAGGIARSSAPTATREPPGFGFRRGNRPRLVLEPDPDQFTNARSLFELYATGRYSDDTLALEAACRGAGTGSPQGR